MASLILSHNKQNLSPSKKYFGCNCSVGDQCTLNNKCLTSNVMYETKISNDTNGECKRYLGTSEVPFTERFRNHTMKSALNFRNIFGI